MAENTVKVLQKVCISQQSDVQHCRWLWLFLQIDGQFVQMLCMPYGPLTMFLYNKASSHAFACYSVADSARRACSAFASGAPGTVPLTTEVVTAETVTRLIEGQQASGWVQMPLVANGSQMPLACKP